MTATASAVTASVADEDLDECGPQLITKLEVSFMVYNFKVVFQSVVFKILEIWSS